MSGPGCISSLGTLPLYHAHDNLLPGCRSRNDVSPTFGCTGGLFAEEAIGLLQRFYMAGNPRGGCTGASASIFSATCLQHP